MKTYRVGLTIHNVFDIEAKNESDAEDMVRELSLDRTLQDADYNITYVDELKGE